MLSDTATGDVQKFRIWGLGSTGTYLHSTLFST